MALDVFKFATELGKWRIMDRREVQYLCESKFGGYNRSTVLFMPTKAAVSVTHDPVVLYQQVTQMRLVSCHNP
jgi:hypothetical protein